MKHVLIDTDVILDFFFDRKPFSNDAASILSLCEKRQIIGYITPVSVSNIYYLLRKVAAHDKVIENIKLLVEIVEIALIKKETIIKALNSNFNDFEDALQNFSQLNENEVKIVLTRNIKDYKSSNFSVMKPEIFLKTIIQKNE